MSERLRVGYIGWLFHDDTEEAIATAVCDLNTDSLDRYVAKHPGTKHYTDYHDLAADPDVDVVFIATPNFLHCDMAVACLDGGKHVFCEKPMGVNAAELDRMLVAERRSGRQLAIDFEMRASYGMRRIKEITDSGELGDLKGLEFTHHHGCWLRKPGQEWRVQGSRSGGIFFEEMCHEVDAMRWFLGEAESVSCVNTPNVLPQYEGMADNAYAHFRMANGAMGHISSVHALSAYDVTYDEYGDKGHDMTFVITGTKGALKYDAIRGTVLVVRYVHAPDERSLKPVFERTETFPDWHAAFHDIGANRTAFLKALAANRPHQQSAADAWRSFRACLAAEKSAAGNGANLTIDYRAPSDAAPEPATSAT